MSLFPPFCGYRKQERERERVPFDELDKWLFERKNLFVVFFVVVYLVRSMGGKETELGAASIIQP